MDSINALCATKNCGLPAKIFGLKGNSKTRSCDEHMGALVDKGMQIFDMSGYYFISSLQDYVLLEERKALLAKGRGNLTMLESTCESELSAALQAIESAKNSVLAAVEDRFEEMKVVVAGIGSRAKTQLSGLRAEFEPFLKSKENELSPTALLACADLEIAPMFVRFGIVDAADSVSALLSDSWTFTSADLYETLKCMNVNEKHAMIESVLAKATESAQRGISEVLPYADVLIGDKVQYHEIKDKILSELLKFEKKQIDQNLKWLQRTWELRQLILPSEKATVCIGKKFATLLYRHFGRFSEAEEILKKCFDIEQLRDAASADSMTLCVEICGVYFSSAQFQQTEELGLWTLETFGPANLSAELYWTTLCYLVYSLEQNAKTTAASTVLEDWRKREMNGGNDLAEMLTNLSCGIEDYHRDNPREAERWLLQAKSIGASYFPTSPFTALSLHYLARLSEEEAREKYHKCAQAIYDAVYSKSVQAAMNLNELGAFYHSKSQLDEAEEHYRSAKSLFEVAGLKSTAAAINFSNLGDLLGKRGKSSEAEMCYRQAESIYEVTASRSPAAAMNLNHFGSLLAQSSQYCEAEMCYRHAQAIYEEIDPKSTSAAQNVNSLGELLAMRGLASEAETCFRQAQSVLNLADPSATVVARNFNSLGNVYKNRKRFPEAERCFRYAQCIYNIADPGSAVELSILIQLCNLYSIMGRAVEAEECYRQWVETVDSASQQTANFLSEKDFVEVEKVCRETIAIFQTADPKSARVAEILIYLGGLYTTMERWNEAEKCYRQAQSINAAANPKSLKAAEGCSRLGKELREKRMFSDAEKNYRHALTMFEAVDSRSDKTASTFFELGRLYEAMEKRKQAIECYQKAAFIYNERGDTVWKSFAESAAVSIGGKECIIS